MKLPAKLVKVQGQVKPEVHAQLVATAGELHSTVRTLVSIGARLVLEKLEAEPEFRASIVPDGRRIEARG